MERSSFFNAELKGEEYDRVYLAEDYARYFASFIGNGVFPTPSTSLQVVADGATMNLTLKQGKAWINGYFYENTEDLSLSVDVADGALNRIDRVVVRLDFINREIKTYIKKGAFASSPVAPKLQRDSNMYELGIANIKINKGVTKLVQANITDLRQNNNYCGLVSGVVKQIDTTNLFTQFQSSFDIWFKHIKEQLSEDAAGNLQNQLDTWLDFKANGGTIGGAINYPQNKIGDSRTALIKQETIFNNRNSNHRITNANFNGYPSTVIAIDDLDNPDNDNGIFYMLGNGVSGDQYEHNALRPKNVNSSNKNCLGQLWAPWDELYLKGKELSGNGYSKLPNGLIIQWGTGRFKNIGVASDVTMTLPIKFPNAWLTYGANGKKVGVYPSMCFASAEPQGANIKLGLWDRGSNVIADAIITWWAIGY